MARKIFGDSLRNAMDAAAPLAEPIEVKRTSPTVARAQASILEEDKHATRLIDPTLIRMSAIADRIDPGADLDDLVASIREHGQKVPVLVRKLPDGTLEIVYGRRRLLACRQLGQKVRASVMEMTDEEAIIAQGVENNARQDPSFIERALFVANIIRELGHSAEGVKFAQTVAYKALQIDESLLSKMNRIATGIPADLIRAIGPAPGAGRRYWDQLYKLCDMDPEAAATVGARIPPEAQGAARLDAAIKLLSPAAPSPAPRPASAPVRISKRGTKITIDAPTELMERVEAAVRAALDGLIDTSKE